MSEYDKTVDLLIHQAQERLQSAAELLRGTLIPASPENMRIEMAVSRAIDALGPILRKP